jgi:hypothetical protein
VVKKLDNEKAVEDERIALAEKRAAKITAARQAASRSHTPVDITKALDRAGKAIYARWRAARPDAHEREFHHLLTIVPVGALSDAEFAAVLQQTRDELVERGWGTPKERRALEAKTSATLTLADKISYEKAIVYRVTGQADWARKNHIRHALMAFGYWGAEPDDVATAALAALLDESRRDVAGMPFVDSEADAKNLRRTHLAGRGAHNIPGFPLEFPKISGKETPANERAAIDAAAVMEKAFAQDRAANYGPLDETPNALWLKRHKGWQSRNPQADEAVYEAAYKAGFTKNRFLLAVAATEAAREPRAAKPVKKTAAKKTAAKKAA